MKRFRTFLPLLLMLCIPFLSNTATAQTTGSYNATITFAGQQRTLSLYVPTNYDPANSYALMICLHGAGDNSISYRNALTGPLAFNTALPNTIFVCPDGGTDQARDFYTPAGDEAIIDSAIGFARTTYNIDTTQIVLQGFSLGGRSALRYGLDHPLRFKGLMLNTPAMQGVKDALNQGVVNYGYSNAGNLPIYITHGANDVFYSSPIDSLMEQLIYHDAKVRLLRVAGLAHNIPSIAQMPQFTTWFDGPASSALDMDLVKIIEPVRSCSAQLQPSLLIRNLSSTTMTAASFEYGFGTNTSTYNWTGSLAPFQHAVVNLPAVTAPAGSNDFHAKIISLNASFTDSVTANNEKTVPFLYETQGMGLPLTEGFETTTFSPAGWIQRKAGDVYSSWDYDNTVMQSGTASMFAFNTVLLFDNKGRKEEMETPLLNLQSAAAPTLSFDVAYNFHRYTPPYLADTTDFADTLEVLVSVDCGATYQSIYKKGGADLTTFPSPIINPLNVNACYATPAAANWRTEQVSLAAFANAPEAIVKFSYISALGGSINIDNIAVKGTLGLPEVNKRPIAIYPNPATDLLNVSGGDQVILSISISDISGRQLQTVNAGCSNNTVAVNTSTLPAGVYVCRVSTANGSYDTKFLIQR